MDLNAQSITEQVHSVNGNCPDERMKFIFGKLIGHLHDFVRETSLTSEEWMTAIQFLTDTGKKCTDLRQEFILLSDTLGVSTLVDLINNAKPPGATEATVLGPFFTEDAYELQNGASIASEGKGDYMFVEGRITDTKGSPIPNAIIDTWETDGYGQYDTQYDDRTGPDCRGRFTTDDDGKYSFRAVVPIGYTIPGDGPVGLMMSKLNRHIYRPAHLHMMIDAESQGFEKLITALYFKGDQYLYTDAVFGVRNTLIVEPETITDTAVTLQRGFKDAKPHQYVKYDFVLATPEEAKNARNKLKSDTAKHGGM